MFEAQADDAPPSPQAEFDAAWKDALQIFLEDAAALFFPRMYADVDWRVPPVWLDKEL